MAMDWWPQEQWPEKMQRLWDSRQHPGHTQRFELFVFFVGNGMGPEHAVEMIQQRWAGTWDAAAMRHFADLPKRLREDPTFQTRFYFDMMLRQLMYINGDTVPPK